MWVLRRKLNSFHFRTIVRNNLHQTIFVGSDASKISFEGEGGGGDLKITLESLQFIYYIGLD
jgi:hypothetical protein